MALELGMVFRGFLLAGLITIIAGGSLDAQVGSAPADGPQLTAAASLKETQWNLIELDGTPVTSASAGNQPYIYLHADNDKLTGSGGCNRLFASFDLDGSALQFHAVAQTLMACPGPAVVSEPDMLQALKLITSYRITGDELELRVDDRVLARFRAEKKR